MRSFKARRQLAAVFTCAAALVFGPSCEQSEADLRSTVQLLAEESGDVAQQAITRLIPYRDSALPYLESALHNAPPAGRRHVVMALRRLDAAQAAALLGHIVAFDADVAVRDEAAAVLNEWAVRKSAHGPAARAALHKRNTVRSGPEF